MQRIYFVTNRNFQSETQAPWFGTDVATGPSDLRVGYGDFDMTGDPPKRQAMFVSPESKKPSDVTASGQRAAPDFSLFSQVQGKMMNGAPDTILFIHGFDYNFEDAVLGGALFKQRLDLGGGLRDPRTGTKSDPNIVVFDWPSKGKMIPEVSYYDDRKDAKDSGEAGGRALLQLWNFLSKLTTAEMCRGRIHIVAHSMGNYVLRNALQALINYVPSPPPTMFEQVLLIAADEDYDGLELDYKLKPLAHVAKRIHAYYNPNDIALDISHLTKGNPRRLGSRGPQNPANIPGTTVLVDASAIARWTDNDIDYHHYYLHAPEMAPDMVQSLSGVPEDKVTGRTPIPGRNGAFRLAGKKK